MSSDPLYIPHVQGSKTPFGMRFLRGGDPLDLTGLTVMAGVEKAGNVGTTSTAAFKSWGLTSHGLTGTISGTIPHTGINFTGDAELRVFVSGSPRQFLGEAHAVKIKALSSNWIP